MKKTSLKIIFLYTLLISISACSHGFFKSKPELLFVQRGTDAKYNGKTLTINGMSTHTIYFSDRPFRLTGHDTNQAYIKKYWTDKNRDSFPKDNPNALFAYYDKDGRPDTTVIEISHPKLVGNSISYNIKILSGKLPKNHDLKEVVLFIDDTPSVGGIDVAIFRDGQSLQVK